MALAIPSQAAPGADLNGTTTSKPTPATTSESGSAAGAAASPEPSPSPSPNVAIVPGYRPGVLGRTLEMHMDHYSRSHGFGPKFEGGLATGIGDLVKRLDRPVNEVWSAVITVPQIQPRDGAVVVERIVGVVYVDGECSGQEGVARLRCFIVDESARGLGVGRKLLDAAMEFVREKGFRECQLSTLSSLTTARSMYEKAGFKPVGEKWLDTFEKGTMSVDYAWRRPESV